METLERVQQRPPPALAVHRGICFAGGEVAGVVEQVDVDQVEGRAVDDPPRSEEALSTPLALREELLRKLWLLLDSHRLDVACVDVFAVDDLKFVRQKIPNFDVRDGVVNEIQVAERLESREHAKVHVNNAIRAIRKKN